MYTSASLEAGVILITSVIITAALAQSHTPAFQFDTWSLIALTVSAIAIEKWCPQKRLNFILRKQRQVPSTGLALGTLSIPWIAAALAAKYNREATAGGPMYSIDCLHDSLTSSAFILTIIMFAALLAPPTTPERRTRSTTRNGEINKSVNTPNFLLKFITAVGILAASIYVPFNDGGAFAPTLIFSIFTSITFWLCMKQLSKTFTLGEGFVIVQGLGLLTKILILEGFFKSQNLSWCAFFTASVVFAAVTLALLFAILLWLRDKSISTYTRTLYSLVMGISIVLIGFYSYKPIINDLLFNYIFSNPQRIQVIIGWIVLLTLTLPIMLLAARSGRIPNIILRKGYHILAVSLFLPALFTQPQLLGIALACAFAVLAVVEVLRNGNIPGLSTRIHSFMGSFVDERDAGALFVTHFALLLGMAIPIWLSNAMERDDVDNGDKLFGNSSTILVTYYVWPAALAGILATGLGDTAASVVGSQIGRVAVAPKSKKTVEGTLAMASVVMMAWMGLVFARWIPGIQCIWDGNSSIFSASLMDWAVLWAVTLLNSLLEASTEQLDNLFVPLHYFALLSCIFK